MSWLVVRCKILIIFSIGYKTTFCLLSVECLEDPKLGRDPLHEAGVSMFAIEGRVDYMGSSVLMTRLSDMKLSVRDEWKIDKQKDLDAPLATTRYATYSVLFIVTHDFVIICFQLIMMLYFWVMFKFFYVLVNWEKA